MSNGANRAVARPQLSLILALVAVSTLGACSGQGQRAHEPGDAVGLAAQQAQAREFAACMTEAGVAADVAPMEGDQRLVADFVSESVATVVWKTPDGYGGYTKGLLATPELEQQAEAALDELSKDRRQEYKLIVDGVDMSKEFEQCYESSGYTDPSRIADPRRELADKEAIVEASLRWAECARANGFPSTKDPIDPVADDYATRPTLTLPKDITAEELNKLLTSCPVWDESGPSDQAAPSIGFDVPGFDGNRGIDKLSRDEAAWYGQLLAQIQESAEATRPAGW